MKKLSIYLAGPDVFFHNPLEIGRKKKELCEKYGFIGHFPLDNQVDMIFENENELGMYIGKINENLILNSDIILANLTPFRGPSADVGTVYEIGFGVGKNKFTIGYSNCNLQYNQKVKEFEKNKDIHGMEIEDFGMIDNLMIINGIVSRGGFVLSKELPEDEDKYTSLIVFEECLKELKKKYL